MLLLGSLTIPTISRSSALSPVRVYNSSMKKLYRSRTDKKIAGVAGGLAEFFDVDPTVVRIIFLVLLLPGGLPGFLPYVAIWILVPYRPNGVNDHIADKS